LASARQEGTLLIPDGTTGRSENERLALGICFEEFAYPYPVNFLPVRNALQTLATAYMDVPRRVDLGRAS
jgi:hypothetical protein